MCQQKMSESLGTTGGHSIFTHLSNPGRNRDQPLQINSEISEESKSIMHSG
jgi:hypothetical protein